MSVEGVRGGEGEREGEGEGDTHTHTYFILRFISLLASSSPILSRVFRTCG